MNILFHHIPKCAGTFLANQYKTVLKYKTFRYFSEKESAKLVGIEKGKTARLLKIPSIRDSTYIPFTDFSELASIADNKIIYAHEFDRKADMIIRDDRWIVITSVRNPLNRFYSGYAQRQRNNCIDEMASCTDLYQFYFFYLEWCRDENILSLTEENAPLILEKAISYLSYFDHIFVDILISQQFHKLYGKQIMISQKSDNITDRNFILQIKYEDALKYTKFIEYDLQFYHAACKIASPI